jgi:tetratricopeptide (TPR) repeat protein
LRTRYLWTLLLVVGLAGAVLWAQWPAPQEGASRIDEGSASQSDPAPVPPPDERWGPAYAPEATAAELCEEARQVAEQVVATYPENTAALAVLARLRAALGESHESVELWQRVVTLDPACAEGYLGIGAAALRRGEFTRAVEALEHVAALTPGDPRLPAALAAAWLGQGRVEQAVRVLEQSAQAGVLSTDATIVLGQAYLQQEQYHRAMPLFERLVQQAPEEPKAYYGLARVCLKLGRPEEARQSMQRFQDFQQRRVEAELRVAHAFSDLATSRRLLVQTLMESAAVSAQVGDAGQAERRWQQVARLEPKHVASRQQLWRLYQTQQRSREALAVGEQLCELEPTRGEHWFNVALLRGLLQQYDTALAAVNRSLELEPQNAQYREARDVLRRGKGL